VGRQVQWQAPMLMERLTAYTRGRNQGGGKARGRASDSEGNKPAGICRHNGAGFVRASFRSGIRRLLALRADRPGLGRLHPATAHSTVPRHYRSPTHTRTLLRVRGLYHQDLGYYPFANDFFSDLTHYIRTGDFVAELLRDASNADELAFAIGALSHYI